MSIRLARIPDTERIAQLSGQLGYPTANPNMRKRLLFVLRDKSAACFVVETKDSGVIGWVHISVTPLLEVERRAEVNGLVVDEQVRSQGAGRLLLEAVEKWARKMKCKAMFVRSNVIRERAHLFYLKHGFEHCKTQKAFQKLLQK
jgi:N-acetylglutamate synthase-like GNAT family acetyltransferase